MSLHIVNIAYLASSYFSSRYSDMSNHFNAPRRIGSFYSAPLDKEPWKLEAKQVFNTDLALLRHHNLGIAQGLGHDFPRAINLLEEHGIDARGTMLFPAPSSKNLHMICVGIEKFYHDDRSSRNQTARYRTQSSSVIEILSMRHSGADIGHCGFIVRITYDRV
jgi:hypothetical protein